MLRKSPEASWGVIVRVNLGTAGRDTPPDTDGLARPSTEGARAGYAGARVGYLQYLQLAIFLRTKEVYVSWTDAIVGCSLCFLIGEEQRD